MMNRSEALIVNLIAAAGVMMNTLPLMAQEGTAKSASQAAIDNTTPPADKPLTLAPTPLPHPDAEVQRVVELLSGSFESAGGAATSLRYNGLSVVLPGLDNAVYFEVSRADAPWAPFRQGIAHAWRRGSGNELTLRLFDITGNPGLKDAMAGIWAAPSLFPDLKLEQLDPNLDMVLKTASGGFDGATPHPFPTMRDGALELTSAVRLRPGEIAFADAGLNAKGERVWGVESGAPITFKAATPSVSASKIDGGMVMLTLAPGSGETLVEGGRVSVHYTGWLRDGAKFDSSRQDGREPFTINVPGQVIKGWNEGLKGIAKGERRRLLIPPDMGYGERGAGRGLIPPNSWLVFDVECLHVDNSNPIKPTPPPEPAPTAQP